MLEKVYPSSALKDPPSAALFKHLFCLDDDVVLSTNLDSIIDQYFSRDTPVAKKTLDMLGARRDGQSWSFKEKNANKKRLLREFKGKFAFVNGREDEGNSLLRYKEELAKKGVLHDDYWLDQLSFGSGGLEGFPAGESYYAIILTNPEPLESDSAPTFLLKSTIIEELERRYRVFPTRQADFTARSKLESLRAFTRKGISTPATLVTGSIHDALQFVKELHAKGKDAVIKPVTK
nr:hypothetical protein [Candidatus Sigynarchaeota archaeon]